LVIHYISLLDTYFIYLFIKNYLCLLIIFIPKINYTTQILSFYCIHKYGMAVLFSSKVSEGL
jgi:hypothetical protein